MRVGNHIGPGALTMGLDCSTPLPLAPGQYSKGLSPFSLESHMTCTYHLMSLSTLRKLRSVTICQDVFMGAAGWGEAYLFSFQGEDSHVQFWRCLSGYNWERRALWSGMLLSIRQ